jgi:hypothetical protein
MNGQSSTILFFLCISCRQGLMRPFILLLLLVKGHLLLYPFEVVYHLISLLEQQKIWCGKRRKLLLQVIMNLLLCSHIVLPLPMSWCGPYSHVLGTYFQALTSNLNTFFIVFVLLDLNSKIKLKRTLFSSSPTKLYLLLLV